MNLKVNLDINNISFIKDNYIFEKDLFESFFNEKKIKIDNIKKIDELINILEEKWM